MEDHYSSLILSNYQAAPLLRLNAVGPAASSNPTSLLASPRAFQVPGLSEAQPQQAEDAELAPSLPGRVQPQDEEAPQHQAIPSSSSAVIGRSDGATAASSSSTAVQPADAIQGSEQFDVFNLRSIHDGWRYSDLLADTMSEAGRSSCATSTTRRRRLNKKAAVAAAVAAAEAVAAQAAKAQAPKVTLAAPPAQVKEEDEECSPAAASEVVAATTPVDDEPAGPVGSAEEIEQRSEAKSSPRSESKASAVDALRVAGEAYPEPDAPVDASVRAWRVDDGTSATVDAAVAEIPTLSVAPGGIPGGEARAASRPAAEDASGPPVAASPSSAGAASSDDAFAEFEAQVSAQLDAFFADETLWQMVYQVTMTGRKTANHIISSETADGKSSFRVQVPRPYPGVQYRRSKNLDDRYPRYAGNGVTVLGKVVEGGEWLEIRANVFLPMRVGAVRILKPVPSTAGEDG